MKVKPKLYLASASPRRIELLRGLMSDFKLLPNHFDEDELLVSRRIFKNREGIVEFIKELAAEKARSAASGLNCNAVILSADTVVVSGRSVLGKPRNMQQAREMLEKLCGKKHLVITGIAFLKLPENEIKADFETTEVWFRKYSQPELQNYLKTGEWKDKAGAYGIQGYAGLLVEKIKGCYFNVMGLPVGKVYRNLKSYGLDLLAAGTK